MNSGFAVLTVSQLNFYVKSLIESDVRLSHLFLRGEISNFTNHYRSGHLYMTIKDENSSIRAVMFRTNAQRLRFMPSDGMKIIASGRVSLYERDGQYQFYIDDLQPDGIGALYVAYNQLKNKLEREGLFDASLKKPLPRYPRKIGVVTSPTGAAFQDIRNVLGRRWPAAEILLYPAEVQGAGAPAALAAGIAWFSETRAADVVICGRGGGSLEELWAFNEEIVARAIAASQVPVVSAVGHETDYTIADFVSDLRAPTPSAAAELVSPDGAALAAELAEERALLCRLLSQKIAGWGKQLDALRGSRALSSPMFAVDMRRMSLNGAEARLLSGFETACGRKRRELSAAAVKLDALSPLKVLSRGYAAVSGSEGVITGAQGLSPGQKIGLRFRDGSARCRVLNVRPEEGKKVAFADEKGTLV